MSDVRRVFVVVMLLALLVLAAAPATTFAQGNMAADSTFRPEKDGLPFPNFGDPKYAGLSAAEVRRLFGDKACADIQGDTCILTPPAEQWMKSFNEFLDNGHCMGFSVFGLLAWSGKINPADFGADSVSGLQLEGNEKLQREISVSAAFQRDARITDSTLAGEPNDILKFLIDAFNAGKGAQELYTLGIIRRDGNGGHAVTPYAIEDRGNGIMALLIWDNNWPGQQREIIFDTNKNSWSYTASINPSDQEWLYDGDATTVGNLVLMPTFKGLDTPWPCPFCTDGGQARDILVSNPAQTKAYNEISLNRGPQSASHLLITDEQGRHYGFLDGKLVKEIPDVKQIVNFSNDFYKSNPEPTYLVPVGMKFTLTVDGTALKQPDSTDVVMVGPGYTLAVYDIKLDPGQKDTIDFSSDGSKVTYKTESNETPELVLGFSKDNAADYEFSFKGLEVSGGAEVNATIDQEKSLVTFDTEGAKQTGKYAFVMSRIDTSGESTFEHDGIELDPKNTIYIDYSKWSGQGGSLTVGLGVTGSGKIDEQVTLTDEK